MCFSAGASFTAGTLLGIAGIATLTCVTTPAQRMIASIPLLFGMQQLAEGFVWIGMQHNNALMVSIAAHLFIFFASVVWPLWLPLSFRMIEPQRTLWFIPSFIAGILVALWFFIGIIPAGITVTMQQCGIEYIIANPNYAVLASIGYIFATVLPLFIAHDRTIKITGALIAASYAITYIFYTKAFISVWCFFAAIISIMSIIIALRHPRIRR